MSKDEISEKVRIETNILKKIKDLKEEINELKNKMKDYESKFHYLELRDENFNTKIITKNRNCYLLKMN